MTIRTAMLPAILGSLLFVASEPAHAQSRVDYIEVTSIADNYCGTRPQSGHRWVLGGGACLTITAAGGTAGFPPRHQEQMTAIGWSKGPNGVREFGTGDDVSLGAVPVAWSIKSTGNESHSGNGCLTDSPAGLYANGMNASATIATSFDLTSATEASLVFWHRWNLSYSSSADIVSAQIRLNGGSWQNIDTWNYTCGFHSSYIREILSLTPYVGNQIELRFNISTSGSGQADGWFIDDLVLLADGEALFVDDFESGLDGWTVAGTWGLGGAMTSVVYPNRSGVPVTYPVSTDRDGRTLATINAVGFVHVVDVPIPTGTDDGMGYVWIEASHAASGTTDGVMGRVSAAVWVPE